MRHPTLDNRWRLMLRVIAMTSLCMAADAAAALDRMRLDRLALLINDFAGSPGQIDPRLLLPDCAAPVLGWAIPETTVAVDCPGPVWRLNISVAARAAPAVRVAALRPAAPLVRRGDRIRVEQSGEGFAVGIEAVAEADARDGRVMLRNPATGTRLTAHIDADGRAVLPVLSAVVNRR